MEDSHILAFSCLAEQEFYRPHFAPHMNSAMFQIFGFPCWRARNISRSNIFDVAHHCVLVE